MNGLDAIRLVFNYETWAKTAMFRTRGRSRSDKRLIAQLPYGRWKTKTFAEALWIDGFSATTVDGAMNGARMRQQLVSTLVAGDLVVLDNLLAHKVAASMTPSTRRERKSFSCLLTVPN